jgi:hypothetical protein
VGSSGSTSISAQTVPSTSPWRSECNLAHLARVYSCQNYSLETMDTAHNSRRLISFPDASDPTLRSASDTFDLQKLIAGLLVPSPDHAQTKRIAVASWKGLGVQGRGAGTASQVNVGKMWFKSWNEPKTGVRLSGQKRKIPWTALVER